MAMANLRTPEGFFLVAERMTSIFGGSVAKPAKQIFNELAASNSIRTNKYLDPDASVLMELDLPTFTGNTHLNHYRAFRRVGESVPDVCGLQARQEIQQILNCRGVHCFDILPRLSRGAFCHGI
jgi:hypothetical protein